ncbi:MAG: TraR/DksA family transcriptional regulator [Acidobacteriaceae bacterium]
MNQELIEENKKKLLAEDLRLRKILGHEGKYDGKQEFPGEYKPTFPELGSEEGDNASEVEVYETNLAVTQDLEARLTKVMSALERIKNGTYGKCKMGDDIEEERLKAVPEADTCMKHSDQ